MRALQLFIAASLITSASVYAQDAAPAHISSVEGSAVVFHAGGANLPPDARVQDESEPAAINMPLVEGDRVRTMARSRVEVMFPDGGSIAIEPDSEVEFVTTTRVRVIAGGIEHQTAQGVDPRSPSTQNLPPDLQAYGPQFDQNGSWQYEQQYGNVWYPTTVSTDWRPYYDGYWSSYPAYGWTWIGYERWAWPTHHYGRWGYAHSRWFWIPGRSYGAAWVSWGTAPGYVSWCPLGYDGRAVVGLSVGFHSSWNAWTVVPRDRFGARGYPARRYAVEPSRIAATTPFIEHRTPPARVARGSVNTANTPADRRPAAESVSRGAGAAVPRGDYGAPSAGYPRRADAAQPGQQPAERRAPGSARDATSAERRAPSRVPNADERANTIDHPAYQPGYQPGYQPRYQPRYEPRQEPANGAPRSDSSYRERRASGDDRARAIERPAPTPPPAAPPAAVQPRREVREAAPARETAAPARATAPPRVEAPPAQPRASEQHGNAPARAPHGGGNAARAQEPSSGGTAVRRPR